MKYLRIWVVGLALAFSGMVWAETKIGFVNTQRVLEQAPQSQAASERLKQEFEPREAALASAEKKLKALQTKRERDGAIMSDAERRKLERKIVSQQREIKRKGAEYEEDLNLRRRDEFTKFRRQAAEVITAIAKESGYDMVMEDGVVYVSDKVDITGKVLARLADQSKKGKPTKGGK